MIFKTHKITFNIFFIFLLLNFYMIEINLFGLQLRDIFFALTILFPIIFDFKFFQNKLILWRHGLISSILIFFLFFYSYIIKGNNISEIVFFIKPILILFLIPSVSYLIYKGYLSKLSKSIVFLSYGLIGYYILVILIFFYRPSLAFDISERIDLFYITFDSFFPRVVFKNFVFVLIPICFSLFFNKKKFLLNTIIIVIIVSTSTFGILIGLIGIYLFYFIYKRNFKLLTVLFFAVITSTIYSASIFSYEKLNSIGYKLSQLISFTDSISATSFLFGGGIGSKLPKLDNRYFSENIIEVSPVMLFLVGGIIGSLFYLFIYTKPLSKLSYIFFKNKINRLSNHYLFFSSIQLGIIFSSISNPYIWSGGVGLLMIIFIESLKIHEWK